MKAIVILNEQHKLVPDQERILNETFEAFEILSVPASGWTLSEIEESSQNVVAMIHDEYFHRRASAVVFASPIPAMIKFVSIMLDYVDTDKHVLIFHNDNREKKELPNGKVIMTVAQTGWELV